MYIYSLLILLFLSTRRRTAIACPLGQPVDNSALLYDFTNFQPGLDPVSKQPIETDDVMNNNYPDGLVEQTQPPPIMPGIISTSSEDTTTTTTIGAPPPITDDSCRLGAVQFQPSSPSSTFDTAGGSSFELAEALPGRKLGPPAPVTPLETVYLCCESVGEDKYVCDSTPRTLILNKKKPPFVLLSPSFFLFFGSLYIYIYVYQLIEKKKKKGSSKSTAIFKFP